MDYSSFPRHNQRTGRTDDRNRERSLSKVGELFVQNQVKDAPWSALDNMSPEEQGLDIWGFLQRRKAFIILLAIVCRGAWGTFISSDKSLDIAFISIAAGDSPQL
ncbi:MAG: hypothetical protein R3C49_16705 [Planctomycetaceae bacterium]